LGIIHVSSSRGVIAGSSDRNQARHRYLHNILTLTTPTNIWTSTYPTIPNIPTQYRSISNRIQTSNRCVRIRRYSCCVCSSSSFGYFCGGCYCGLVGCFYWGWAGCVRRGGISGVGGGVGGGVRVGYG
jgi:hypothetical protein